MNGNGESENSRRAAMITRLLSHFWTADDHPQARAAQIEDWLHDLAGFSYDAVAEACAKWRIAETRRPAIADIYRLAVEVEREQRARQERLEGPSIAEIRAERQRYAEREAAKREQSQAEGREIARQWAIARGYADLEDYAKAEKISYGQACLRVILSNLEAAPAPKRVGSFQSLGGALGVRARETSE